MRKLLLILVIVLALSQWAITDDARTSGFQVSFKFTVPNEPPAPNVTIPGAGHSFDVTWYATVAEETEHYNWYSRIFFIDPDGTVRTGAYKDWGTALIACRAEMLRKSGRCELELLAVYSISTQPPTNRVAYGGESLLYKADYAPQQGLKFTRDDTRPELHGKKPDANFSESTKTFTLDLPSKGKTDEGLTLNPGT
jgi:hypothetical protein